MKKVKRELKVKTNSDADIVVDKNGTTEVELTEVKKRFGRAKLLRVVTASPHRAS